MIRTVFAVVATATMSVPLAPVEAQQPSNPFTAAGFKVQLADTPEKLAHLRRLPADKLVTRRRGDKVYYIYADPNICRCAYVGTPEAYRAYQTGSDGARWPGGQARGEQMIDEMNEEGAPTEPGAPSFDDYVFGGIRDDT